MIRYLVACPGFHTLDEVMNVVFSRELYGALTALTYQRVTMAG